jgi:hypothetical protein
MALTDTFVKNAKHSGKPAQKIQLSCFMLALYAQPVLHRIAAANGGQRWWSHRVFWVLDVVMCSALGWGFLPYLRVRFH